MRLGNVVRGNGITMRDLECITGSRKERRFPNDQFVLSSGNLCLRPRAKNRSIVR